MKKRILSLLLVATILTSVCAFAPLNAGAENVLNEVQRQLDEFYGQ